MAEKVVENLLVESKLKEDETLKKREVITSLATDVEEEHPDYEIEIKDPVNVKKVKKTPIKMHEGQQGNQVSDLESYGSQGEYLKSREEIQLNEVDVEKEKTASLRLS